MLRPLAFLGIAATWAGVFAPWASAQAQPKPDRFLEAVRAFGKTLDRQYARPREESPAEKPPGSEEAPAVRARGVWPVEIRIEPGVDPVPPAGEANLLHEATTLAMLRALSETIDEGSHRLAANGYVVDFLAHAQSPHTGLLGWGPALAVPMETGKPRQAAGSAGAAGHELLPRTTPWEILWDTNPEATTKAIAGLEHHFLRTGGALFAARGPYFDAERPKVALAHCEDSGLLAHAFAFLYHKTGERRWLERARTVGDLYWSRRDPATRLVPYRLSEATPRDEKQDEEGGDQPAEPMEASSRQVLLGYFLLKAWKEVPHEEAWGSTGLAVIKAYDTYAFVPAGGNWNARLRLDGSAVPGAAPAVPATVPPRPAGTLLTVWEDPQQDRVCAALVGRAAAYASGVSGDRQCLEMARRAMALYQGQKRPREASIYPMAHTLNLSLDLYDLTQDKKHLDYAQKLGDDALLNYFNGRLFRSRPGGDKYDARLSTGDLAAGLLRLHLRLRKSPAPRLYDWTF